MYSIIRTEQTTTITKDYFTAIASPDCSLSSISAKVSLVALPVVLALTLLADLCIALVDCLFKNREVTHTPDASSDFIEETYDDTSPLNRPLFKSHLETIPEGSESTHNSLVLQLEQTDAEAITVSSPSQESSSQSSEPTVNIAKSKYRDVESLVTKKKVISRTNAGTLKALDGKIQTIFSKLNKRKEKIYYYLNEKNGKEQVLSAEEIKAFKKQNK
jgi:hypothetical protein